MTAYASALNQIGQQGKHRRWITFGCGGFANGQANFTLGMCHTCQAVDQHQNIQALIAKIFGNDMRHVRGF